MRGSQKPILVRVFKEKIAVIRSKIVPLKVNPSSIQPLKKRYRDPFSSPELQLHGISEWNGPPKDQDGVVTDDLSIFINMFILKKPAENL